MRTINFIVAIFWLYWYVYHFIKMMNAIVAGNILYAIGFAITCVLSVWFAKYWISEGFLPTRPKFVDTLEKAIYETKLRNYLNNHK